MGKSKSYKILKVVDEPKVISETLVFSIPGYPPSVNHTYGRGFGGRLFKKSNVRDWETVASIIIRSAAKAAFGTHDLSYMLHKPIEVTYSFYRPTWKGKTKKAADRFVRKDLGNFEKVLTDIICKTLGIDDAAVVILKAFKLEDLGAERTMCELTFLEVF